MRPNSKSYPLQMKAFRKKTKHIIRMKRFLMKKITGEKWNENNINFV